MEIYPNRTITSFPSNILYTNFLISYILYFSFSDKCNHELFNFKKIRNSISLRLLNTNFKYPSSKTKVKTAIYYSACTHINPTIVSLTKYTYTYQTEYTFISQPCDKIKSELQKKINQPITISNIHIYSSTPNQTSTLPSCLESKLISYKYKI